jgi:hypothetical protein
LTPEPLAALLTYLEFPTLNVSTRPFSMSILLGSLQQCHFRGNSALSLLIFPPPQEQREFFSRLNAALLPLIILYRGTRDH